jgi:VanZ family protein
LKTLTKQKSLLVLWVVLILFMSLYPFATKETKQLWEHSDKIVHFALYFVLSVLVISGLHNKSKYAITLIISVLFGIIIEALQEFMKLGRTFSMLDILANSIGVCIGLTSYYFLKKHGSKGA